MSGLRSTIGPRQTVRSREWHDGVNHCRLVTLAKHDRVATNPVAFRVVDEMTDRGVECTRQVDVVAVEKRDHVASHSFEAFIDCVYLATIFFTHPVSKLVFVALDDRNTVVRAAAID